MQPAQLRSATGKRGADDDVESRRYMDEGNHALVSSARKTGEAAAILPVVSTLSFGFATGELLAQRGADAHGPVLVLLSLSAVFSLFTTTYSVLEYYYISMLTASDTQSHYGNNTARSGLDEAQRDELARHVWDFLLSFEPWRRQARNALWLSVMLILAAGGAQTALEHGSSWESYAVCLVLVCGIYLVPRTVLKFRRRFVPLLKAYRELKGFQGGGAAPPGDMSAIVPSAL